MANSRALIKFLRHEASDVSHVTGGVNLELASQQLGISPDDIFAAARADPKGRFYMMVGATQGHSFPVPGLPLNPNQTQTVYHGTTKQNWAAILRSGGLSPMTRQHVHMATSVSTTRGLRQQSDVIVRVDVQAATKGGVIFLQSLNDVVLCSTKIPTKYLSLHKPELVLVAGSSHVGSLIPHFRQQLPHAYVESVCKPGGTFTTLMADLTTRDLSGYSKLYMQIGTNDVKSKGGQSHGNLTTLKQRVRQFHSQMQSMVPQADIVMSNLLPRNNVNLS